MNEDLRRAFESRRVENKAIIGSIASILRPGKAIQVSLQGDNRWLTQHSTWSFHACEQSHAFLKGTLRIGVRNLEVPSVGTRNLITHGHEQAQFEVRWATNTFV